VPLDTVVRRSTTEATEKENLDQSDAPFETADPRPPQGEDSPFKEPLENGEIEAKPAFLVYRSHLETDHQLLSGCREDLRKVNGAWKVARRTIVPDINVRLDRAPQRLSLDRTLPSLEHKPLI
jgi:Ring hydroxylating beta subunit